jgi:hypothetical protein
MARARNGFNCPQRSLPDNYRMPHKIQVVVEFGAKIRGDIR